MTRWRWVARSLAWLYLASLLAVAALFAGVGERWWVSGLALYAPRLLWAAPLPFIAAALVAVRSYRLLWTQIVAGLVLAFPLMGCVLPGVSGLLGAGGGPAGGAPSLRVLSYNVNSFYGGVREIDQEIVRYSPDVVLLQEAWTSGDMAAILRARYPTVEVANQFLLATRYPVVSSFDPEKITLDGRDRSARFVEQTLDTPLGRIAIYNAHPISPRPVFNALRGRGLRREILSGRLFSPASAAVFYDNSRLREAEAHAVAEAAAHESDPVIIAGDTNLPGLSPVFRANLSRYQDGFTRAGAGFGYTFPTNRGAWMRIDRVLAGDGLRFVRFQVGSSPASDHFCVVADLQPSH